MALDTPVSGVGPGHIFPGTILSVNTKTFVAEVALDHVNAAIPDVTVASLYCHPFNGEGVYFLPEPEASCYVMFPSDGAKPFILGYYMPITSDDDPGSERGGRRPVNPGDIVLTTRDDNFVILRRGGVVEVGATPLAQTLYIPMGNFIRTFFENYEALSPLGEMSWTHTLKEHNKAGTSSAVHVKFKSKKSTSDSTKSNPANYAFDFEVFEADKKDMPYAYDAPAHGEVKEPGVEAPSDKSFLRFYVRQPSDTEPKIVFALQVAQSGAVHFGSTGRMTVNSVGHETFSLGSMRTQVAKKKDDGTIETTYARLISEDGQVIEYANDCIHITSKKKIVLKADLIELRGRVELGEGPLEPTIGARTLKSWLQSFARTLKKRPYLSPVASALLSTFPLRDTTDVKTV